MKKKGYIYDIEQSRLTIQAQSRHFYRAYPTCESNMLEISCALTFTSSNCKENKFLATWTKSEMEYTSVGTQHLTSSKYILPSSK